MLELIPISSIGSKRFVEEWNCEKSTYKHMTIGYCHDDFVTVFRDGHSRVKLRDSLKIN